MANILTISRIILALLLLRFPTFSFPFTVLYVIAGLTDMLDGVIARKTDGENEVGAKLDTAADFVFTVVCLIKLLPVIGLPLYFLIWTAIIAAIKIINIISGFVMQRKFVTVHSILNKLTGLMLFVLPLTIPFVDLQYSGYVVCVIATLAAVQEGHLIRTRGKES